MLEHLYYVKKLVIQNSGMYLWNQIFINRK